MEQACCIDCRKPGASTQCGVCAGAVCKKCRLFLSEEEYPFASERPPELKHTYYCRACHAQHVEPFAENYASTLEQAKAVNVFYKDSKSTVRILRRALKPVRASGSPDRNETILHLAFQAARDGFNSLIDVEVSSEKVRNAGWQSSVWTGKGLPADVKTYENER